LFDVARAFSQINFAERDNALREEDKMEQTQLSESYQEYERRAYSVGISIWHFEWCSKYRYKMFGKEEYCNFMGTCIRRAASEHGIKIVVLGVLPEHVHCEVELPLNMALSYALQILKGRSAYCGNRREGGAWETPLCRRQVFCEAKNL